MDVLPASGTGITARVLHATRRFADTEAIVDGPVRISYAGLGQEILRATRAAMASGIERGDPAAVWAPNGHRYLVAALGILGAGGVLVPLSSRFKGGEAGYALGKSRAAVLFSVAGFLGCDYPAMLRAWLAESGQVLPELRDVVLLDKQENEQGNDAAAADTPWDRYLARGAAVSEAAAMDRIASVGGDDPSDILFTSGTTGRPKGARSAHGQVTRLFDAWSDIVGLRHGDRELIVSPFSHTFGYKAGWVAAFLRGATVIPVPVFEVENVARIVDQERITFLSGPPTLLQELLLFAGRERYDLSSLRTTVTGGADIPVELIKRLRDELTFEHIFTGYGLTETNGPASICRAGDDPDTIATFSGRAMPGTELKIAGPDGAEVPRGELGEIMFRGFSVMTGYLDDPAATAATIDSAGWLRTGDLGLMDERGYLRVTGRSKDMYVVGGFNAYPAEIEDLLLGNPGIAQVAVIGVPDKRLGEVGVAYVVPRAGVALAPKEVIAWARTRMSNYKVPRHVEVRGALPANDAGKVMKEALRRDWREREQEGRAAPGPARRGHGQLELAILIRIAIP
jgi:acyl-CoA synthetase (AMP-forming)/AMP-acid ligase II